MRVVADLTRLAAPAALAVSAVGGFAAAGVAASAPASAASDCSGVTVVVQYPSGTATGCAPGNPGTAFNALHAAGFSTTGTVGFGDAFICSINGYPMNTMCPRTPPTNAYWAIFWANSGGSWVYSNLGGTLLPVKPGQSVGFRFGSGAAPSVQPAAPAATSKPTPSTSKPAPAKPTTPKPAASKPPAARPTTNTQAPATPSSSKPAAASGHSTTPSASSTSAAARPSSAPKPLASTAPTRSVAPNAPVTVKTTKSVTIDGKKRQLITFDDGSSITVDENSSDAKKYRVGVVKPGTSGSAPTPSSTSVAVPSNSSHPSISTSGSVPAMPAPEAKDGGNSNLPGILAGVGVLGVAGVGAGYTAMRRRG